MNTIEYFKERFDKVNADNAGNGLESVREKAFGYFQKVGIPTVRHEEWKYTRVSSLFNNEFEYAVNQPSFAVTASDVAAVKLPGSEEANELVFVNGLFSSSLSTIRSQQLVVMSLADAVTSKYKDIVAAHLGHSSKYLKDGINALSTAFVEGGVFIYIKNGLVVDAPLYVYNIADARGGNIFSQPRSLFYIGENAQVQIAETYSTLGVAESFTNQVMELVVEKDALVSYYKIQNDAAHASQVSTTHIRQIGKSYVHAVTISLSGAIVRNNLNIVLEAPHCETHLYGLYFVQGNSHVDNHTTVDNVMPHSFSNQLYKGILDDNATGVFNGKIYVQPDAQKTNAYQSNKNVLLSDSASVNTKPQLEIFADDVKCSHGCTVGQLNEEGLFYLQSRGISQKVARSLLLHAFAVDILEHINPAPLRSFVDELISKRLEFDTV